MLYRLYIYCVAWNFWGTFILSIGDFLRFAGTKCLRLQLTEISAGMELIFAGGFLFEQQNINKGIEEM